MTHQHDHITGHPHENAIYWQSDTFNGLDLLRATYYTHTFGRHIHEGFAVGVIEQGAVSFYCRGEDFTAGIGRIILANPGEIHAGHAADASGWTYRMFYPSAGLLHTLVEEITGRPWETLYFPSLVIYDSTTAGLLRRLHVSLEKSRSHLESQDYFYEAFSLLLRRHAAPRPKPKPPGSAGRLIARTVEYLLAHLAENVSLDTLAQQAGMSPYHFLRLFKQEAGLPPHAYQNHLRIEQAKALLVRQIPTIEIAAQVGFSDQSHLIRHFKKVVGVTPGQYAAR